MLRSQRLTLLPPTVRVRDCSKVVENQSVLRITSGLCLSKSSNESTLAIRIMEVSKNHQNQVRYTGDGVVYTAVSRVANWECGASRNGRIQRFRLQIALPQCQLSGVTPAPAVTEAVLVLSKKVRCIRS